MFKSNQNPNQNQNQNGPFSGPPQNGPVQPQQGGFPPAKGKVKPKPNFNSPSNRLAKNLAAMKK